MGFTDNYTKKKLSSTNTSEAAKRKSHANEVQSTTDESILLNICADGDDDDDDFNKRRSLLIPDQEILDSTEPIYFQEDVDTGIYELNVSNMAKSEQIAFKKKTNWVKLIVCKFFVHQLQVDVNCFSKCNFFFFLIKHFCVNFP